MARKAHTNAVMPSRLDRKVELQGSACAEGFAIRV